MAVMININPYPTIVIYYPESAIRIAESAGRSQTQKMRPIVKLPSRLKPILLTRRSNNIGAHVVHNDGQPLRYIEAS